MSAPTPKPETLPAEGYYGSRIVTSPLRRVYRDDGYYGSRVVASPGRRIYRDEVPLVEPAYTSARVVGDYAPIAPRYIGGTVLSGSVTRRGYGDYYGPRISDSVLRRRYYGGYGDISCAGGVYGSRYADPYYGSRVIYDDRYAPIIAPTSAVPTTTATTVSAPAVIDAPTRIVADRLYDYPVRRIAGDYYDGYSGYAGYGPRYAGGYYDGGYGGVYGGYGGFVGGYGGAYGYGGGYLGGYYGGSRYLSSVPRSIIRGGEYVGRYGSYIPYESTTAATADKAAAPAASAEKK